jgi:hypothetical protein
LISEFITQFAVGSPLFQSKPQVTAHVGEDVEKEEISSMAGGIANWHSLSGKSILSFLRKLEIDLPEDPAIPILGRCCTMTQGHMFHCVHSLELIVIARSWKQPKVKLLIS